MESQYMHVHGHNVMVSLVVVNNSQMPLPTQIFFPSVYDIKYLMKFCDNLHGGLNKLAELLDVARIGPQHQAGSDSLLTSATFMKLAEKHFAESEGLNKHQGVLYGLGNDGNNELLSAVE